MKLAEALLLRADLQKKLASLNERLGENVIIQEGDKPAEEPTKLLKEVEVAINQLEKLIFKINKSNLEYKLKDGTTLTEALARRDVLMMHHSMLSTVARSSTRQPVRYGVKEIKWVSAVDVAEIRKKVDDLAEQIRLLNAAIQEANWQIEI